MNIHLKAILLGLGWLSMLLAVAWLIGLILTTSVGFTIFILSLTLFLAWILGMYIIQSKE